MKWTTCLCLTVLAGCTERSRPDPSGPGTPIQLAAEVVAPRPSETLAAGAIVSVRIRGSEKGLRLNAIGFVARRFQGGALDSVVTPFAPRVDTTVVFGYRIPADLPTNAQIDFVGIAYSGAASIRSIPASVIIIGCAPNVSCRQ